MRIRAARVFPVETRFPHQGGTRWLFLGLETDSGIVGYGEVMLLASPFRLSVTAGLLVELIEQYVIGEDPSEVEGLWERIYARAGYSHYPEHTKLALLSGIEMACWDILGKDLGQPVVNLLGGPLRDRVRTYTYLYLAPEEEDGHRTKEAMWLEPDSVARRGRDYVAQGFTAVKYDPFGTWLRPEGSLGQVMPLMPSLAALEIAEASARALRDSVGSECDILIGTHGQMTSAGAIRLARRLEAVDPLWLEEPVPPENISELAKVARETSIPIATGERLTTVYDFARLVDQEAAAIFNFDLGQVGGILQAKKITALAEAHYLQITPHLYCGPLVAAASIQLALCSQPFLIMETVERFEGMYAELVDPPFEWVDGYVIPSGRPGLGHDLVEDVARRHAPADWPAD